MKTEIPCEHGYIFDRTDAAYLVGKKVIIHKGGTGSGKTFDIMTWLIGYAVSHPGQVVTVVSESRPHLDIGAIRILKYQLLTLGIYDDRSFNGTKGSYTFTNGAIIEFFSTDRLGKAVGARRHVLYGNEINHQRMDVWEEMARRSELVVADFNPTEPFWLEKWLAYQEDYIIIKSNYKDNPFLPETERRKIKRRAEMDTNFYRVHILCEYGTTEGVVFTNWGTVQEIPECKMALYGIDFGYTNHPTAVIWVGINGDDIYLKEEVYATGLTNQDIGGKLKALEFTRGTEIVADSAEPKSIEELRRMGYNVIQAQKGADSVQHGIDLMKRYRLNVDHRSVNLIRELRAYTWMVDRSTGDPLNRPIDDNNHAIDAVRYAISWKLRARDGKVLRVSFG